MSKGVGVVAKSDSGQGKFSLTKKGLKLKNEILWLNGEGDGNGLVFLAHHQNFFAKPYRFSSGSQYIVSEKLFQSLFQNTRRKKTGRVLSCPIGRPFSLGLLTLCLFSSGDPEGGSWLLITTPNEKILYADHFPKSLKQIPAELKDVENLQIILNAATPYNLSDHLQDVSLEERCDLSGKEILRLFKKMRIDHLYLYGRYTKEYANKLKGMAGGITCLYQNGQGSLF